MRPGRPGLLALALTAGLLAAPAAASAAVKLPGSTPLSLSVRGSATITSTWIDKEACAEGYVARLVQRVAVSSKRPVRLSAVVAPQVVTDGPAGFGVTATSRIADWAAVPPLGCGGALLQPKPVPPRPGCPAIRGRAAARLSTVPARNAGPDLDPISTNLGGQADLLLVLSRETGPRAVRCSPGLPPANTEPVAKEDVDGAPVVAALPDVREDVFLSVPLEGAYGVLRQRRSKREWILKLTGDCTDQNLTGRGSKEKPGPDGDEISCVVKGRFEVSLRNLRR